MSAYYNEIDPFAAQWLRELIKAGHIAPGIVDERSIEDVKPDDLREFTQCHFFAGIGVWSYALRQAGWPDDQPVWTGSCPCQPFSAAGKGAGFTDERHLWPAFFHLITQCVPDRVFGEQVASKDGLAWLDLVQADLEAAGYCGGAVDICAAGVGAPHIRQRLWFVAERFAHAVGGLANAKATERGRPGSEKHGGGWAPEDRRPSDFSRSANTESERRGILNPTNERSPNAQIYPPANTGNIELDRQQRPAPKQPGPTNGFWRAADWLGCRDGKWRPVEPGTSPLANGAPVRVGRLRGYGNAINAEVARIFIESYLEIT